MKEDVEQLKQYRIDNQLGEAIKLVQTILKENTADEETLVELIKILLLANNTKTTVKLFKRLNPEQIKNFCEPELLIRLKIKEQSLMIPDINSLDNKISSKWANKYLSDKEDEVFAPNLTNITVNHDTKMNYIFTAECPSCGEQYKIYIPGTLLIVRDYLCPHCYCQNKIDFDMMKVFLEAKLPKFVDTYGLINESIKTMELTKNLNEDFDNPNYPLIAKYFFQDTIHDVIELITPQLIQNAIKD